MNLDRLQVLDKYKNLNHDLNKDEYRRVANPKSFDYSQNFDGFDEKNTLPGADLPDISYKKEGNGKSLEINERRLREQHDMKYYFKEM